MLHGIHALVHSVISSCHLFGLVVQSFVLLREFFYCLMVFGSCSGEIFTTSSNVCVASSSCGLLSP